MGRPHAQIVKREPGHVGPDQGSGPHGPPGHGGKSQKPDQGDLAGRQARMGEKRNADGDADPEARHRFGKRRDAVHDQQHRADARPGTITDPACQIRLRARVLQHL